LGFSSKRRTPQIASSSEDRSSKSSSEPGRTTFSVSYRD